MSGPPRASAGSDRRGRKGKVSDPWGAGARANRPGTGRGTWKSTGTGNLAGDFAGTFTRNFDGRGAHGQFMPPHATIS